MLATAVVDAVVDGANAVLVAPAGVDTDVDEAPAALVVLVVDTDDDEASNGRAIDTLHLQIGRQVDPDNLFRAGWPLLAPDS